MIWIRKGNCGLAPTRFTERGIRNNAVGRFPESFLKLELYQTLTLKLFVFEFKKSKPVKQIKL